VTTAAISSITGSTATAGGNVTSEGSASVSARGVCYATTQNPTTSNTCVSSGSGAGSFTASLTGLSPSTTYYVRAYATNSVGTAYGANVSFTTTAQARPILKPLSSSTSVTINQPFRIDVEIGSGAEVQNLYGIAFKLRSQATYVSYIDGSAARGTFLGSGILEFFRKANEQTVEVSLTKTAAPGVSGKGVVASANFISTQTGNVTFELIDVTALDPAGQPIALTTENLSVSVTAGASMCVYPGDTNNDSAIDGSDLIPIGLFYGQTLGNSNTPGVSMQCQLRSPWPADSGTPRRIYADANGDGTINASDVLAIGLNYGKARPSAPPAKIVASSATVQPEPTTMELNMEHRWLGSQRLRLDLYSSSTRALQGLAATIQLDPSLMERVSAYRVVSTGSPLGDRTLSFVQPFVQSEAGVQGYELSVVSTEAVTSGQGGPVMSLELDLKQGIARSVPVSLTRLEWVEADQSWYQLARLPQPYILTPPQGSKDAADQAQEDVLESNYPNPFNPVTQLRYRLGEDTRVRLEVYTMTGTLVKVLVDRYQSKGSYTVDFDGSELSSGVYLYRLQTPSYIKTNKMVLIK